MSRPRRGGWPRGGRRAPEGARSTGGRSRCPRLAKQCHTRLEAARVLSKSLQEATTRRKEALFACAPANAPARCEGRAKEERARRKSLIAAAVGGPSHDKVLIDVGQCVCVFQQRPHWSAHETHDIKTKRERELQMQKLCLLRSVLYS